MEYSNNLELRNSQTTDPNAISGRVSSIMMGQNLQGRGDTANPHVSKMPQTALDERKYGYS